MKNYSEALSKLRQFQEMALLNAEEVEQVGQLFAAAFPFAASVAAADSIHLHIKVEAGNELPLKDFPSSEARIENQKEGYCKFATPLGLNLIFSSIPTSQEDLTETRLTKRPRPFLDHIGIDLRQETEVCRQAFEMVPQLAAQLGWSHVGQGGQGKAVYCCHTEVAEKHWVYPDPKHPEWKIPLEFAFGPLKINDAASGCDLRPFSPAQAGASANAKDCCEPGKC